MPDVILPVRTTKLDARRTYDRLSRVYDLTEGVFEAAAIRHALTVAGASPGEAVLEIGPGTGRALDQLGAAVGESGIICGVDISRGMLARAQDRTHLRRTLLAVGDAAALPLVGGRFDLAFMSFVLELLPTDEIPRALAEVARVLKPRGRLINLSLSREQPNAMTRLYEWGHRMLPRLLDCRPIYGRRSIEAANFEIAAAHRTSVWGLPAEIVLARKPRENITYGRTRAVQANGDDRT
jgi:demethylmenaquinone methyltransferase/2-methoxy-6-polyprenyl-1,4-benzoquinol methylase